MEAAFIVVATPDFCYRYGMPRPNTGPRLHFVESRKTYYILWYERGDKRIKSTGTADRGEAEAIFRAFKADPTSIEVKRLELLPVARMQRRAYEVVYFIGGNVGGVKIGVAVDVQERLKVLQTGSPVPLSILATAAGGRALEADYHRRFAPFRLHGEWFAQVGPVADEIARLNKMALVVSPVAATSVDSRPVPSKSGANA